MKTGTSRRGRRWVTGLLVSAASAGVASASDFVAGSGDFTVGPNWSTGVAPGAGDVANINNGGTAYVRGATTVPLRAADDITVAGLRLGVGASDAGNLIMNGGTLTVSPVGPVDYATNAVLLGDLGTASFTLSGGTVNLPGSDLVVARGGGLQSSVTASLTMGGGTVNLGGSLAIAPNRSATVPPGAVTITGGTFNVGRSVYVGQSQTLNAHAGSSGQLVVGGTARLIIGNSLGEGNAAGSSGDGALALSRLRDASSVTLQDSAVVKALRLTTGWYGSGQLNLTGSSELHIVNSLGGVAAAPRGGWNSFAGGGNNADGSFDGTEGSPHSWLELHISNNALLDVDASAAGRDPSHPELQGLALTGLSHVDIRDSAKLVVRQRLVLGTLPTGANLNGFDGQPQVQFLPGAAANDQRATVTMTGGTISADHILLSGGTIDASGGRIETKAYNATYDPTANGGAGSATTSVNAIRVGYFAGTEGGIGVNGTTSVSTGELSIGHYGTGKFGVMGGAASVQARDVVVQKFAGSTGTVSETFTGPTQTAIRATNDVTINGGTLALAAANFPAGVYRWDVMEADSDHDGVGSVKGRFSQVTGAPFKFGGDPRVFSVVYSPTKVTVGLSYAGDADYSGTVNFADLLTLAKNYNKSDVQWTQGDFTGDGVVNFGDLLALAKNYNAGTAPAAVPGASAEFNADVAAAFAAAVPEPGGVALVGVVTAGVMGRRRRRRVG